MLSHQSSNHHPGRHERQNSTPIVYSPRTTLFQQDEQSTEDEYQNRQRLIQALMQEVQQQHSTARPGHEQPETLTRSIDRHQSLSNIQPAPCQEHGTGFFMDDQPSTPMTAWENSSNQRHSLQDEYNTNTMDMFQSFDSTTSAGYLDGFGIGHDEIINTNEMPHGMPSIEDSQRPTTGDGIQRPCTPFSQTRTSQ